eukprot:scaffold1690_cov182-Amphora_coffeaeformis.AAC.9
MKILLLYPVTTSIISLTMKPLRTVTMVRCTVLVVVGIFLPVLTSAFVAVPSGVAQRGGVTPTTATPTQRRHVVVDLNADPSSLPWVSTTNMNHVEKVTIMTTHNNNNPLLPVLGSSGIMFVIVGLLYAWEGFVGWARQAVGKSLQPVVESILAEMGGLGFIGLLLQTFAPANREFLEHLSVQLFGEEEILMETFEFLHTAFFQVGVGFFVAAGAMVALGIQKLYEIETIEELQVDLTTGACTVTPETLARYLPYAPQEQQERTQQNLWNEIAMSTEERAGKSLLMRYRLVEQNNLPETFRIEKYIEGAFAENLLELVELSPLTWIYLIPVLALANSIDLSHDVINANSPNAFESSGFFFSTPWAILPSVFTVLSSSVWGIWNCWKMTEIKYMLLPRLGRTSSTGEVDVLAAPIDVKGLRENFNSSPSWVQPLEALWAKPAVTDYDRLFGMAGAAGLDLYRNSIKIQSWLCITNIVFFGTQIVPRDLGAILSGAQVGAPEYLTIELLTYGSFVVLSLLQLLFVSPRAFWNYCLVACLEEGVSRELLESCAVSKEGG